MEGYLTIKLTYNIGSMGHHEIERYYWIILKKLFLVMLLNYKLYNKQREIC